MIKSVTEFHFIGEQIIGYRAGIFSSIVNMSDIHYPSPLEIHTVEIHRIMQSIVENQFEVPLWLYRV